MFIRRKKENTNTSSRSFLPHVNHRPFRVRESRLKMKSRLLNRFDYSISICQQEYNTLSNSMSQLLNWNPSAGDNVMQALQAVLLIFQGLFSFIFLVEYFWREECLVCKTVDFRCITVDHLNLQLYLISIKGSCQVFVNKNNTFG